MASAVQSRASSGRRPSAVDALVAVAGLAAIVAHDVQHVVAGRWYDLFWLCNAAALLAPLAVVLRSAPLAEAALIWLLPGTAVWLADLVLAGSNVLPTSTFAHFGGLATALYGVWRSGPARRGVAAALALLGAVVLASRLWLPPAANVNAAHAVPAGWVFLGAAYSLFAVTALAIVAAVCAVGHALAGWLGRRGAQCRGEPATADG